MKKLTLADIRPASRYEAVRDELRRRAIEEKRHRRVRLGPQVSLVFENTTTMLFQVEEMVRAEHIEEPAKIEAELEVFNPLLPEEGELTATLFVEVVETRELHSVLGRLVGIDEHVTLEVDGIAVKAEFEQGRSESDRISAVQYLRFRLPAEARAAMGRPGTRLVLSCDHPRYRERTVLSEETRVALSNDMN